MAAFSAFEDDDDTFFRAKLILNGVHYPFAITSSITGEDIHMDRTQTFGAVISTARGSWWYLCQAVETLEAMVFSTESWGRLQD